MLSLIAGWRVNKGKEGPSPSRVLIALLYLLSIIHSRTALPLLEGLSFGISMNQYLLITLLVIIL